MAYIEKFADWQAPSFFDDPGKRMGWAQEQVEEGENWIKGQSAYGDINTAIDIISGKVDQNAVNKRSDLTTNPVKYAARKIIGVLSDVREVGRYTSDAKFFKEEAEMLNTAAKAIYLKNVPGYGNFPSVLRQALQYMSISACGYVWPKFVKRHPRDKGDLVFESYGLLDILPVQLPHNNDIQGAYAVTVIVFMPVWMAHAKFPAFQKELLPMARRRYSSVSLERQSLASRFKYGNKSDSFQNLYCEIRYTFIHDLTINTTGEKLPMGDIGASWGYEVPSLGDQIPDGQDKTREAKEEDCMIYPHLRCMISSKSMRKPMYDGPAFDWHGMIPLAKYCADDWVQEPCGFSLVRDVASAQRALQRTERGVDQVIKARLDPFLGFDRSAGLNDKTAGALDPFSERGRIGVDGEPLKVLQAMLPEWLLSVPGFIGEWMKYLKEHGIDAQLGLNEMANLAEMKMNMNSEGAEKALAAVGPVVKDIAAGMERSTGCVGEMVKFDILQYYDTQRIMTYVGPDGVSHMTLDFNPDELVPSHGPDELAGLADNVAVPHDSKYSKQERARLFAENLTLTIVPHTMHNITQTQEMLKWLQLFRGGAPLAFSDVAKKLNIDDWGETDGATGHDRYLNEQKEKIEMQLQAALLAKGLGLDAGGGEGGEKTGPKGGQAGTGGRPPSGQKAGKIKQKTSGPSGPRTTVSESG